MENVCRANNNNYIAIHHLKIKRRKAAASRSKWGSQPFSARERKRKCIEMLERERTELEEWYTHTHTDRPGKTHALLSHTLTQNTQSLTPTLTHTNTHTHIHSHIEHTHPYIQTHGHREKEMEREREREKSALLCLYPPILLSLLNRIQQATRYYPRVIDSKLGTRNIFLFPSFFEPETLF